MNDGYKTLLENPKKTMISIIQRVATGPELSKSISYDEARAAMNLVLDGKTDPIQAAIFLIGLRVKRETEDENKGVLQGILDHTQTVTAEVDELVDVADPYNGYERCLPSAPFIPVILAEAGMPSVTHGMETVAPKFGVTHRQILQATGKSTELSTEEAARQISNPEIAWAYVDQSQFCPKLYQLAEFRKTIVKRTVVTTAEVLTGPIRAKKKTHLLTGFVHNAYPPIYTMLARHSGFDTALLVRGTEGGVTPSLRKGGEFFRYCKNEADSTFESSPSEIGIGQLDRLVPIPTDLKPDKKREFGPDKNQSKYAEFAANAGLAALSGEKGPTSDALLYTSSLALWHTGRYISVQEAAEVVKKILAEGKAAERFRRAA